MSVIERTAAGLQTVIPGCERRTLPKSKTRADENGQGLLPLLQAFEPARRTRKARGCTFTVETRPKGIAEKRPIHLLDQARA